MLRVMKSDIVIKAFGLPIGLKIVVKKKTQNGKYIKAIK